MTFRCWSESPFLSVRSSALSCKKNHLEMAFCCFFSSFSAKTLPKSAVFVTFVLCFINKKENIIGMEKIDKLDKKILSILSKNARMPFKDVAAECGVSRAAVHQRVQHLIEDGVITGSGFDVNPKSLGYSTCTYVGLNLERGSMYKTVVKQLVEIPEIVECHFTTGPYTMLVKLYARDNEQLMDLLNNKLQSIPGVVSTETLISLEQSIHRDVPVNDDGDAAQ